MILDLEIAHCGISFCYFRTDVYLTKTWEIHCHSVRKLAILTRVSSKNSPYFVEFVLICSFFFRLSFLDVLILLHHLLRSFLLFFLSSREYRCKRARKINTHTHTRIDESPSTRPSYSTVVLARNPGFNVSLMNLSLLLRHVTTTIISPEEVFCLLHTFSPLFSSAIFLPLLSNSDPISNRSVAHWLLF